jgi:hypothetical protein
MKCPEVISGHFHQDGRVKSFFVVAVVVIGEQI